MITGGEKSLTATHEQNVHNKNAQNHAIPIVTTHYTQIIKECKLFQTIQTLTSLPFNVTPK